VERLVQQVGLRLGGLGGGAVGRFGGDLALLGGDDERRADHEEEDQQAEHHEQEDAAAGARLRVSSCELRVGGMAAPSASRDSRLVIRNFFSVPSEHGPLDSGERSEVGGQRSDVKGPGSI
jgi:hypothetical protein